jgi:hypothetical protein
MDAFALWLADGQMSFLARATQTTLQYSHDSARSADARHRSVDGSGAARAYFSFERTSKSDAQNIRNRQGKRFRHDIPLLATRPPLFRQPVMCVLDVQRERTGL